MKHWWERRELVNQSPPEGHQRQQLRHLPAILDQIHQLILTDWPGLPKNWHQMPDGEPIYDWSVALHQKTVWLWVQLNSVEQESLLWVLKNLQGTLAKSFKCLQETLEQTCKSRILTVVSVTMVSCLHRLHWKGARVMGSRFLTRLELCLVQQTWNINFIFERAVSSWPVLPFICVLLFLHSD